jgi:hypothetical protein
LVTRIALLINLGDATMPDKVIRPLVVLTEIIMADRLGPAADLLLISAVMHAPVAASPMACDLRRTSFG